MEFQEHCESSRGKKWLLAEQKGQCDSNMCLPIETPDERLDGKQRRRLRDQKKKNFPRFFNSHMGIPLLWMNSSN